MIRVACFTAHAPSIGASTRYRVAQYLPILQQHGIAVNIIPFASLELQKVLYQPQKIPAKVVSLITSLLRWTPKLMRNFDIAWVLREAALFGPPVIEQWMAKKHPLVFDFDDAIFVQAQSRSNGMLARWARPSNKTTRILQHSHLVLAGNSYLAQYASLHCSNVHVLPTTVDHSVLVPGKARAEGEIPTIGWIGSHSTTPYLEMIVPALTRLAQTHRFRLYVVGADRLISIPGIECVNKPWRLSEENTDFQTLDIGVYPMPDNPWTHGKCGLKAIQYGAVGIPTVCNPVGVNTAIVQDGVSGLYATTQDEWVDALGTLIDNPGLRQQMGQAARDYVSARYDMSDHGRRIAELFQDIYAKHPVSQKIHDRTI